MAIPLAALYWRRKAKIENVDVETQHVQWGISCSYNTILSPEVFEKETSVTVPWDFFYSIFLVFQGLHFVLFSLSESRQHLSKFIICQKKGEGTALGPTLCLLVWSLNLR